MLQQFVVESTFRHDQPVGEWYERRNWLNARFDGIVRDYYRCRYPESEVPHMTSQEREAFRQCFIEPVLSVCPAADNLGSSERQKLVIELADWMVRGGSDARKDHSVRSRPHTLTISRAQFLLAAQSLLQVYKDDPNFDRVDLAVRLIHHDDNLSRYQAAFRAFLEQDDYYLAYGYSIR